MVIEAVDETEDNRPILKANVNKELLQKSYEVWSELTNWYPNNRKSTENTYGKSWRNRHYMINDNLKESCEWKRSYGIRIKTRGCRFTKVHSLKATAPYFERL